MNAYSAIDDQRKGVELTGVRMNSAMQIEIEYLAHVH